MADKKERTWCPFFSDWMSALSFTISIILYVINHTLDIYVGISLFDGMGLIIILLLFLPIIPTIFLILMRAIYLKRINQDIGYKHTLLGINWLDADGSCCGVKSRACNVIISILYIICRVDTLRSYCALMRATHEKNTTEEVLSGETVNEILQSDPERVSLVLKRKTRLVKKCDRKLSAHLFLIMVFQTLPQCCLQIYIFGGSKSVSIWQLLSIVFSIADLSFNFTTFQICRWNEIWQSKTNLDEQGDALEAMFDETNLESISQRISRAGEPRSISISLKFKRKEQGYVLQDETLGAAYMSDTTERNFYFTVHIIADLIGSPAFFLTAFPTITLYCVISGRIFMCLYLPVFFEFIERFWWWRPETYRKQHIPYHTLNLAFKMVMRMLIMGLICVWFVRVMKYSNPTPKPLPSAIPSFVWPKPTRYLSVIAGYNTTDGKAEWTDRCDHMDKNKTFVVPPQKDMMIHVYQYITDEDMCTSQVSVYLFCIIFYTNIIGSIWEFITYILFVMFLAITHTKRLFDGPKKEQDQGVLIGSVE